MKTFKQFIEPEEFIAFSNAGGPPGQYDDFDYTDIENGSLDISIENHSSREDEDNS